MTELSVKISANLCEIERLNMSVRTMNATIADAEMAHLVPHLLVQIEVATMRINNLMFWVKHWLGGGK